MAKRGRHPHNHKRRGKQDKGKRAAARTAGHDIVKQLVQP
jgi:hypothetical protein